MLNIDNNYDNDNNGDNNNDNNYYLIVILSLFRAPLNSPSALSNFYREPKNVLVSIHNICKWLLKMQLGSLLEKILISSPVIIIIVMSNDKTKIK